jgi:hypothetical protein
VTDSANLELVRSLYTPCGRETSVRERGKGMAGMEEHVWSMLGAWEGFRLNADEYRELEPDRILVLVEVSGRGKASGLDLSGTPAQGAHILRVRGGQVTRSDFCWDRDHALADLGFAAHPEAS